MKFDEFVVGFDGPEEEFAAEWAKKKHEDTYAIRKSTLSPYWVHPDNVAKLAKAYGGTKEEIIAAIAHDTIEDTNTTYKEIETLFGKKVADLVKEVTNNNDEILKVGKEKYMSDKLLHLSDSALFVKLCDMLHNGKDYPTAAQAERMYKNLLYIKDKREMSGKIKDLYDDVLAYLELYISNNKSL